MTRYLAAAAADVNSIAEWVITSIAGAFLLAMLIRGLMAERAQRRRTPGYGAEAARWRRRYNAAALADLSRDDVDPGCPAVKKMLPDCARDLPETPQREEGPR